MSNLMGPVSKVGVYQLISEYMSVKFSREETLKLGWQSITRETLNEVALKMTMIRSSFRDERILRVEIIP